MTGIKLLERRQYAESFQKDAAANKGQALRKGFPNASVKATDDNVLQFIISNGTLDRDHDTINVHGWDLTDYMKNPVVLWAHDSRAAPIGKSLDLFIRDENLISDMVFIGEDIMPFAHMVDQMYRAGFMSAVSVGFMPDERVWSDEQGGIKFLTQKLLEYSAVPVPSNPEALIQARSAGIDILPLKSWCEEVLDGWGSPGAHHSYGASRKALERMFKEADDKKPAHSIPVPNDKIKEIRQRNIWEPRIKKFEADGTKWDDDAWGGVPTAPDCKAPEFLQAEYQTRVDLADAKAAEDLAEYVKSIADEPVTVDLVEVSGLTASELVEVIGRKGYEVIILAAAEKNDSDELAALIEEAKELKIDITEIGGANQVLTGMTDKDIERLTVELEEMTEDRDETLMQLAEVLTEEKRRVDPAELVGKLGAGLAKAIKTLTGSVD